MCVCVCVCVYARARVCHCDRDEKDVNINKHIKASDKLHESAARPLDSFESRVRKPNTQDILHMLCRNSYAHFPMFNYAENAMPSRDDRR